MPEDPNTLAKYEAFCSDVVRRMIERDPDTRAVVNTMRHQQRKKWSDVVRCFRRHIHALGVEREVNLGLIAFKNRMLAHDRHCEPLVTKWLRLDPVRRYRVRALRRQGANTRWADVALGHRQELIDAGIATERDFNVLTFDSDRPS